MTPDDEALVEAYARAPDDLPPSDRTRAEALIEEDAGAASLFAFFTTYYSELDDVRQEASPRLEEWIRQLDPVPRELPLRLAPPSYYEAPPLAIAGGVQDSGSSQAGNVLISEAEDVVAHVLIDQAHLRVRVLAPDHNVVAHALLSLPAASVRMMLDAEGRGSLERLVDPAAPDLLRDAALYPARRTVTHALENLLDENVDLIPGFRLCIQLASDEAKLVPPLVNGPADARFVGVDSGTDRRVVETTEREAVVSFDEPIEQVTVAVYG